MEVLGCWLYLDKEEYPRFISTTRVLGVFQKSQSDQGRPADSRVGHIAGSAGNNANLEVGEDVVLVARELKQSLEQSEASSPADTKVTHTDPGFVNQYHTLGLDIYDENNPSEYGPSP
jgi:hypothetical protein